MVHLTGGNISPIRFDQLNLGLLLDGDVLSSSPSSLSVEIDDGSVETFVGSGFQYDATGVPTSGTITSIRETFDGELSFEFTGLSLSVSQLLNWASTGNSAGALETVFSGNDTIVGTAFDDLIRGYAGHDKLFGGEGADTLYGGDGNDHLYGQSADGGPDAADKIDGGAGNDYIQGNAGNDTLLGGGGADRIQGGQGNDFISTGGGDLRGDTVNGNRGDDTIYGGSGNDLLRGGQGNDYLQGENGDDTIIGDLGQDTLAGVYGIDTFIFGPGTSLLETPDTLAGLGTADGPGGDLIDLGFRPTALLKGTSGPTMEEAYDQALILLAANPGAGKLVAIDVGEERYGDDVYLFYSDVGGSEINAAIYLSAVIFGYLDLSNFA